MQMSGKDLSENLQSDHKPKLLNGGGSTAIQLVQEKQLSITTDAMLAEQLFGYKNQLEVKAVFIPVLRTTFAMKNLFNKANVATTVQTHPTNRYSSELKEGFF